MGENRENDVLRYIRPQTGAQEMFLHAGDDMIQEAPVACYLALDFDENGVQLPDKIPTILYRATLTAAQRRKVADGEDIFVAVRTFGKAPQPTTVMVGPGAFQLESCILDPKTGEKINLDPDEQQPTFEKPKLWTPDQGMPNA